MDQGKREKLSLAKGGRVSRQQINVIHQNILGNVLSQTMLTQLFGLHFWLNKYKFSENQEKITSRKYVGLNEYCRSDESKFYHVWEKGFKLMLCGIIMLCNHSDVPYNFISLCFTANKTNKWPD